MSESQRRFFELINKYPRISYLWDMEKNEVNVEAYKKNIAVMSSGEKALATFFMSVWTGNNKQFDITDAAANLDLTERTLIAEWLINPFWP